MLAKKSITQKGLFAAKENVLYIFFFFSCLKAVIFELMLLELGDLFWSFLLRIFFKCGRVNIFLKYFSCFILEVQKEIQNHHDFWVGGWVIEWCERIENKAISAFNYVDVEV